jgi:hypothetical protein
MHDQHARRTDPSDKPRSSEFVHSECTATIRTPLLFLIASSSLPQSTSFTLEARNKPITNVTQKPFLPVGVRIGFCKIKQPWQRRVGRETNTTASLFLARTHFVECTLQFFQLLSSLAKLAFSCQALVVGQVFGGFRDERIEIRPGLS